ncbi:MAG TPA: DUF3099 domain-containing protein [Arthrobacter sp.]|nr:DUF3099 domain-containing protein [Arthrobacter sp.]
MSKHPHGKPGSDETVHSITDARMAHTDEMRSRMIKYSVSMGIRLVCLILVFVVEGWLQWAFIAGAVVLPYFAVIIANGGSDTSKLQHSTSLLDAPPARELEGGPGNAGNGKTSGDGPAAGNPDWNDGVVPGEVVDDAAEPGSNGQAPQTQDERQEHRHKS